ncbi:hypothetical protein Q3G72_013828 [Acer saccharum]|nr:hypothetical protein Q3G72_013828 [Acer saccharum]
MKDQIRSTQFWVFSLGLMGFTPRPVIDLGSTPPHTYRAFAGRELHRRCASLPSGDGVVATAAAAKNLGLKKLDFALGK